MNEKNALYWIWLQQALGYAVSKPAQIAKRFPSARAFYEAGEEEWRLTGLFTAHELKKLSETTLEQAGQILERCKSLGQNLLTLEDEEYPLRLREIYNPPAVLYWKGCWPDLDKRLCIAIVGTRQATPYGKNMAFQFGLELAQAGATVVSGGALGVDSASHKGALQGGGLTIAVLGCGLNFPYLAENADLRYVISQTGAVISEYPPDTPAAAYHFPKRNRIISGLCQGTLVVEAGRKSGSLITATLALEQGRDVFALPGDVRSVTSSGTNELIKSGARIVTDVRDILEDYGEMAKGGIRPATPAYTRKENRSRDDETRSGFPFSVAASANKKESRDQANGKNRPISPREESVLPDLLDALSADGKTLYRVLSDRMQPIELLMEKTKLPAGRLLCAVTELELSELLQAGPGRSYRKIR